MAPRTHYTVSEVEEFRARVYREHQADLARVHDARFSEGFQAGQEALRAELCDIMQFKRKKGSC